jgi:hypothetical protein
LVAGKHVLRCIGLDAAHQPLVYTDRDFNVLAADLETVTPLAKTHGSVNFTTWTKTDATVANPRYSVHVVLSFTPDAAVNCPSIGFIQSAQILEPQGASQVHEAGAEVADRQTTLGWTIDRVDGAPSPFYGTRRDAAGAIELPAELGTFGAGGAQPTAATLDDLPRAAGPDNARFESCAVCRSGDNLGQVYGCATWGYTANAAGQVTLMPRSFRQMPSSEFEEARAAWNTWQAAQPAAARREAAPALRNP